MAPNVKTLMLSEIRRVIINEICANESPDRDMQTCQRVDNFVRHVKRKCQNELTSKWPGQEEMLSSLLDTHVKSIVGNPIDALNTCLKYSVPLISSNAEARVKEWVNLYTSSKKRRADHKNIIKDLNARQLELIKNALHQGGSASGAGPSVPHFSLENHMATSIFVEPIPIEAVDVVRLIENKSTHRTYQIKIHGTQHFQDDELYSGWVYKGRDRAMMYESAQKYIRFKSPHPALATSIGLAYEVASSSWDTIGPMVILPFMNGGTLAQLFDYLPHSLSRFRTWSNAIAGGPRRADKHITAEVRSKMRVVYNYVPEIALALAEGVVEIHKGHFTHTKLNCKRVKLNFDDRCTNVGVAIGDWQDAIHFYCKERRPLLKDRYLLSDGQAKYPWLQASVFEKSKDDDRVWGHEIHDIYALGYIYDMLLDFVQAMRRMEWFNNDNSAQLINPTHMYQRRLDKLEEQKTRMMCDREAVFSTRPKAVEIVEALQSIGISSAMVVRQRRHMKCMDALEMSKLLLAHIE